MALVGGIAAQRLYKNRHAIRHDQRNNEPKSLIHTDLNVLLIIVRLSMSKVITHFYMKEKPHKTSFSVKREYAPTTSHAGTTYVTFTKRPSRYRIVLLDNSKKSFL